MTSRRYLILLAMAAAALIALSGIGALGLWVVDFRLVARILLIASIPFSAAIWLVLNNEWAQDELTQKRALWLILGSAAVMRLILLPAPTLSTDIFRYIWDGRVQAAGINPFAYVPADKALSSLRDATIYPFINRAEYAPTIYPPVAQIVFFAVTRLSEQVWAMKLAMVAFESATIAAVVALLRGRGMPPTRILILAWHPLPVYEFAGSGHVDAIAIAFMMFACLAAERRSLALSGIMLAGGTLAKFFPLVIAPALYRRWDWRAPAMGAAAVVAGYAVYIGAGWKVLGFLPGYAQEENWTTGGGFFLLGLISEFVDLPRWAVSAYLGLAAAGICILSAFSIMRPNPDRPSFGWALVFVVAFTIILSPHLSWYFSWMIPFLCFVPRISVLYLTLSAPLIYGEIGLPDNLWRGGLIYLPTAAILAIEAAMRFREVRRVHQAQAGRQWNQ